ncbi:MAG: hypothetical protein NTX88_02165 [Candidatus Atribacteria bacterium]|nr:hypothetical protein [Candidatus Atribacteria bacterium]
MKIVFYPSDIYPEAKNYVENELSDISRDYPQYVQLFKDATKKLERDPGREQFETYCETEHISNLGDELWEFRFPKQSKRAVLRIYFIFSSIEKDKIVLLDCEVKTGRQSKTGADRKRLIQYRKWEKGVNS